MLLLQDREYLELSSLCKRQRWRKVGENPGAASDGKQHENRHDVQGLRVDWISKMPIAFVHGPSRLILNTPEK